MNESDLLLVFPQWQGAGPLPRLRESALEIDIGPQRVARTSRRGLAVVASHDLLRGKVPSWETIARSTVELYVSRRET